MCFDEIQAPTPEICDQAEQETWCWRVLANTTAVQAVQLDDGSPARRGMRPAWSTG
jgi:hypothetical protein